MHAYVQGLLPLERVRTVDDANIWLWQVDDTTNKKHQRITTPGCIT
jgi:hypothetical protein